MKILLFQTLDYFYCIGGAHRANRILLEKLASSGHRCEVIVPTYESENDYHIFLENKNVSKYLIKETEKEYVFQIQNVVIYVTKGKFHLYSVFFDNVEKFKPDIILVSEDHSGLLLEAAMETSSRVIYISHTKDTLPFGDFYTNERMTDLLGKADGLITVSNYVKNYIFKKANLLSKVIYFPSYGDGPYPYLGDYNNKYITMINPSGVKGIDIFLQVAKRMPEIEFAAVPTWSTNKEELEKLKESANITILEPNDDVNVIYAQTRILLVPSLWGESFGQVVVEAMLRGIPVIASNIGGLPEAIQGCDYTVEVEPITEYKKEINNISFPVPIVPTQNIDLWIKPIQELLEQEKYQEVSQWVRRSATDFAGNIGVNLFVNYFKEVLSKQKDGETEKDLRTKVDEKYREVSKLKDVPREQMDDLLRKVRWCERRRKVHDL